MDTHIKFYQTGTFTVGNRLLAPEQRSVQADAGRTNSLNSGHRACQGCGEALGARYAIDAAMRACDSDYFIQLSKQTQKEHPAIWVMDNQMKTSKNDLFEFKDHKYLLEPLEDLSPVQATSRRSPRGFRTTAASTSCRRSPASVRRIGTPRRAVPSSDSPGAAMPPTSPAPRSKASRFRAPTFSLRWRPTRGSPCVRYAWTAARP